MIKNSLDILKKIESAGYTAYIVGGMTRDYYMKKEFYDVDICTNATPKDLINIFKDAILPKEKYGAVTLHYNNMRYEITTFRKELKYENRRPIDLIYTSDFYEDIKRRDFTINTLCMTSNNEIIDIFNGKKDIDNKIIKTVGNADIKLSEDPLRILRAIRFATQLNFKLDKDVANSIKKNGHLLHNISYFRKKEELNKIFGNINSKYGIKLLCELKLDKYLELNNLNKIKITSDILGMWSELDVLDKYPFSKLECDTIKSINQIVKNKKIDKYEIFKYGLYISTIAGEILGINKKNIIKLNESLIIHSSKEIDISANEICSALNKKPDKWLKEIYEDILLKILNLKLKNNKEEILKYIIKNYK